MKLVNINNITTVFSTVDGITREHAEPKCTKESTANSSENRDMVEDQIPVFCVSVDF